MDVHYSVLLPTAFVVGEDELKKLSDLLSERIGKLEIRADCAGEVARTFKNVKEVGAYENAKGKEIRRLHLFAYSDNFDKRATIVLCGSLWRGISLDLQGRDDVVTRLRMDLLEIIGGMRIWYAGFHRVDFVAIALFAFFLLWFGSLIGVAFKWVPIEGRKEEDPHAVARAQLAVYGLIAILLAIGLGLNCLRNSVFPRAVFLISQGKRRFQLLEKIQWGIVIGFVVSLAASLVILVWQAIVV
jgi:hypothetical protein